MKRPIRIAASALCVAIPILGLIGYAIWSRSKNPSAQVKLRKIAFYQDSMHPWVKSEQPGKCTICSMDLTPIYQGEKGFTTSEDTVVLRSNSITVLNVQTEEVKRQPLLRTLRVAGTLEAIEGRKSILAAPAASRIDHLAVEFTGVEVQEGQTLVKLFSPELSQKNRYLRAALGNTNILPTPTTALDAFTGNLVAPRSGTVIERPVVEGQYVAEGEKVLTIVDSSMLWFRFDVYQRQLPWVEPGQPIEVTVEGLPGKVFPGVLSFIEPSLNEVTRTVKVRADIGNPVVATNGHPRRLLRFGMYGEGIVRARIPNVLAVPRSAILFPGGATYAYVEVGDGGYERRQVKLGRQGDDLWEILEGLDEDDRVVTSGNVLIDAQAQFQRGDKLDQAIKEEEGTLQAEHDMPKDAAAMAVQTEVTNPIQKPVQSNGAPMVQDARPAPSSATVNAPAPVASVPLRMDPREQSGHMAMAANPPLQRSKAAPDPVRRPMTRAEQTLALASVRDEMRSLRWAAMAEAQGKDATEMAPLTVAQRKVFETFVTAADGLSRALAADNLDQFNQAITNLSSLLAPLEAECGAGSRWSGLIQGLVATKWQTAKNLAEARKQFLPFSTATVKLVEKLRKEAPEFARLKTYHCPMAPKPGLWMQAKGPLRNPFFGAEMLECGKEVLD